MVELHAFAELSIDAVLAAICSSDATTLEFGHPNQMV